MSLALPDVKREPAVVLLEEDKDPAAVENALTAGSGAVKEERAKRVVSLTAQRRRYNGAFGGRRPRAGRSPGGRCGLGL